MNDQPDRKKLIPFFPDYILDELIAWYIALALLIAYLFYYIWIYYTSQIGNE